MKNTLPRTINWISNFGVSQEHPGENDLIRLYNQMSLLSMLGTLQVLGFSIWMGFSEAYIYSLFFILFIYTVTILSNYFGKYFLARYIIAIGSPLWNIGLYVLFGGFFCQGLAIMASIAIVYVAFQKKPKTRAILLVFQVVLFPLASIYINIFGPIMGVVDIPYDEIVVFLGGLGWTVIVFYTFNKDRSKLLKDLKINNEELKNTTEELERFTYIASHDLKSPLRTIISFIGLIERDIERGNYKDLQKNLNFVKTGAKQMNFLVQDILELSTLNNFNEAERTAIDLNLVYEKAKQNLSTDIEEKNAIIHCETLPKFMGTELDFLLLFQNFIQNGIKYNDSKYPSINISTFTKEENLYLCFKDNGIGIEEQYHEQIFQFFKRLHTSEKYQGTGLGLGLCKKIIGNYNGRVEIDSQIGQGSTFTIILPLIQPIQPRIESLQEVNLF